MSGTARQLSRERYDRRKADDRSPMTINETAAYLGCSRTTVRRLLDEGQLPFVVVRNMRRVLPIDADEYMGIAS